MSWVLGPKVPAKQRWDRACSKSYRSLRVFGEEFLSKVDDLHVWNRNSEEAEKTSAQPLINEDPAVLGIVAELDDVEAFVVCFNQMGLGAAPHLSDEPQGVDGHRTSAYLTGSGQDRGSGGICRRATCWVAPYGRATYGDGFPDSVEYQRRAEAWLRHYAGR